MRLHHPLPGTIPRASRILPHSKNGPLAYGGVIRRTGTGEDPVTAGPVGLVPFPQPFTLSTVTLLLPYTSTALMNTWRNSTNVTGVVLLLVRVAAFWSYMGKDTIELLLLIGLPERLGPIGLLLPARI